MTGRTTKLLDNGTWKPGVGMHLGHWKLTKFANYLCYVFAQSSPRDPSPAVQRRPSFHPLRARWSGYKSQVKPVPRLLLAPLLIPAINAALCKVASNLHQASDIRDHQFLLF